MNPAIVYGGILLAQWIYHRLTDERKKPEEDTEVKIPLTAEGSVIPIYFGRVRVRQPILTACGEFETYETADGFGWSFNVDLLDNDSYPLVYGLDMLFAIGIPFENGVNRMHGLWAGDTEMLAETLAGKTIEDAAGEGNHEQPSAFQTPFEQARSFACGEGLVEFLNGNSTQQLVDDTATTSLTFAADRLSTLGQGTVNPARLPGYRGYTSAFLFNGNPLGHDGSTDFGGVFPPGGTQILHWIVGVTSTPPAYSFEVSSYPNSSLDQRIVGDYEANPADAGYAILRDHLGKLGLDPGRADYESWRAAAEVFRSEGNGYSRSFEGMLSALDALQEICAQTDSAIDEDPLDGLIKIKPIRADFDPTTIPHVTVNNCERLEGFAAGGWTGIVNKVRVVFENRDKGYETDSVTAHNQANAAGQDGQTREVVLQMPGVKTDTLALAIASRELAARSRPISKMRAICDRSFWRCMAGDPVAVTWPEYQISGRIFRVAAVSRGTADSNTVALDLIEDFFYTHRFETTDAGGLPSHPPASE